ncbi:MAG: CBS domain-containing protein [Methanomicrobiales archaeon]|jgi:IMP dehydrogenase|nr:CBS domain-containing protein [Methanomicrobiales archaeon]
MEKKRVRDYMTETVDTISIDAVVSDVVATIDRTSHDGFPVVNGDEVVGYISARDIIFVPPDTPVREVFSKYLLVAEPDMAISDVARVIVRSGIQKLPVVDEKNRLCGIISNTDVVRSQIEHVSPEKVYKLMDTLERLHNVVPKMEKGAVPLRGLRPTQSRIYQDELEGRIYELKRGLAEPIIAIKMTGRTLLVDGHHRAVAAQRMNIKKLEAYIIIIEEDIELGLERTARRLNLEKIADIEVMDYARHPLVAGTHRVGRQD